MPEKETVERAKRAKRKESLLAPKPASSFARRCIILEKANTALDPPNR